MAWLLNDITPLPLGQEFDPPASPWAEQWWGLPGIAFEAGGLSFTGTIATTQAAQSAALAASERFLGIATASQAKQTAAAAALLRFPAAVSAAQVAQTDAITALLRFAATVAAGQSPQAAALAATERFTATVEPAQAAQSAGGAGTLRFIGAVDAAQSPQAAELAAAETFAGGISASQLPQAAALTGTVVAWDGTITGTVATAQAAQVGALEATVANPAEEGIVFFPWEEARPRVVPLRAPLPVATGRIATAQARQSASLVGATVPAAHIVGAISTEQGRQWGISFADVLNPTIGAVATSQPAQTTAMTARERMAATVAAGQVRQSGSMSGRMTTPKLEEQWLLGLIDDLDFLEAA